jgi:hypothetical protein
MFKTFQGMKKCFNSYLMSSAGVATLETIACQDTFKLSAMSLTLEKRRTLLLAGKIDLFKQWIVVPHT